MFQSILGHASRFVRPPLGFNKSDELNGPESSISSKIKEKDLRIAHSMLSEQGDAQGASLVSKFEHTSDQLRNAVLSSNYGQDDEPASAPPLASPEASQRLRKVQSEPVSGAHPHARGHAHNPLDDHLYLNIGTGPANDGSDEASYLISESPPAADFNVFERAYSEEVTDITRRKGESATVYLTRRVEGKMTSKFATASANAGIRAGTSSEAARSAFSSLVSKATGAARDATQAGAQEETPSKDEDKR